MLPKKPLVKKSRVCRRSKQVSKQAAKPWLFAGVEDSGGGGKKIRKPYTITKSRESWTDQEHDKFLEALQLFDRDWKKIEAFVGSKTVIQIRSHAQKYFLKVQKNGTREHVPPPRSKRKAAHPYPQKAPKNVTMPQTSPVFISASQPDLEYYQIPETVSVLQKSGSSFPTTSWVHHTVPPIDVAFIGKGCEVTLDEVGQTCVTPRNVSRSTDSCPCTWHTQSKTLDKGDAQVRVKPDFSQVYQFIGSVFDPDTSDHLKKLQKLDPIDVETVLLLMRNLSVNLHSPEFEEHKLLLSSYDANTGEGKDAMCQDVDESMALVATGEMQSEGKAKVQEHESSEGQLKGNEVQVSADSLRCNPNESTVTGTISFHSNVDEASEISSYFSNEHPA